MGTHKRVTTIRRILLLALALAVAALPDGLAGAQTDSAAGTLALFEPVSGTLDARNPADEWMLEGRAGQPVALLVTGAGGLDPMLEVIAPDGTHVAANDDLDSLVRDAGLEALALPVDGAYTVRVERYEGTRGPTEGQYELLALPGYAELVRRDDFAGSHSTWLAAEDGPASLVAGRLRVRAAAGGSAARVSPTDAIPLRDLYFQADARVSGTPSYAEFGLVVRIPTAPGAGNQGYIFKVNTAGQWSVVVIDALGEFTLENWQADPALDTEEWTLSVLAQDTTLTFYANGALLGSVTDGRLTEAGSIGLMAATDAGQDDEAQVLFDEVVVTRRLGTTYRGMPLALTTWADADHSRVIAELAASGHVTPGAAHDLYITSRTLEAADPTSVFELIGSEQALYGDFVFGASVVTVSDGEEPGCGLLFRYVDEQNLGLAYVDASGGFGLVQAQDGELTTNVYDHISLNAPNPDRLLLIAQGEQVTLYVNGALVAQESLAAREGRTGIALLNYEDVVTRCVVGDLWVWPLIDGTAGDE